MQVTPDPVLDRLQELNPPVPVLLQATLPVSPVVVPGEASVTLTVQTSLPFVFKQLTMVEIARLVTVREVVPELA